MVSGKVIKRSWRSGPRRTKQVAYGYTIQVNGRQERKFNAAWTAEQARDALAARILDRDAPKPPPPASALTFEAAVKRYLILKARRSAATEAS